MHSHLIPGIDDGAKSLDQSMEMLGRFAVLGYHKIITTPHVMSEYYPNDGTVIRNGLALLQEELSKRNIRIDVEAAAEYYADDMFIETLEAESELLTFGDNHVLFEVSMLAETIPPAQVIFELCARGYRPILAHPERYLYYADSIDRFQEMKEQGCQMQVNLLSLTGHYGRGQYTLAWKLLNRGLIDYLASDAHHINHLTKIETLLNDRKFLKWIDRNEVLNAILA